MQEQQELKNLLVAWHNAFGTEGAQTAQAVRQAKRDPLLAAAIETNTSGDPGRGLGQIFRRHRGSALLGFHISGRDNEAGRRGVIWTVLPVSTTSPARIHTTAFLPGDEKADEIVTRLQERPRTNLPKTGMTETRFNEADRDTFLQSCEAPAVPNPKMQAAFTRLRNLPQDEAALCEIHVGLHDLINASMSENRLFFLNPNTGEISSKHPPAEEAVLIPQVPKYTRYDWLKLFIATVKNRDVAEKLLRAIDGEGAFRRFKRTVIETHLSDAWHAYRDEQYAKFIHGWLARLGWKQIEPGNSELTAVAVAETPSGPRTEEYFAKLAVVFFRAQQAGIVSPEQVRGLRNIADDVLCGRPGQ